MITRVPENYKNTFNEQKIDWLIKGMGKGPLNTLSYGPYPGYSERWEGTYLLERNIWLPFKNLFNSKVCLKKSFLYLFLIFFKFFNFKNFLYIKKFYRRWKFLNKVLFYRFYYCLLSETFYWSLATFFIEMFVRIYKILM